MFVTVVLAFLFVIVAPLLLRTARAPFYSTCYGRILLF